MSFWDSVKKFTQPYSEEDEYDYDEETEEFEAPEQEAAPRARRTSPFAASENTFSNNERSFNGQVLNSNSNANKQEVVLFHAKTFDDAAKAADELRRRKAIILNMENVDKALTRRVVDFLSGTVYALDGSVKKIAQSTYLFCPHNMDVVGDLETLQAEVEAYI